MPSRNKSPILRENAPSPSRVSPKHPDIHDNKVNIVKSCASFKSVNHSGMNSRGSETEHQELEGTNSHTGTDTTDISVHFDDCIKSRQSIYSRISTICGFQARQLTPQEASALQWSSHFDYLLFSCAMVIGTGNLFRFPLYILKYGTLNFLCVYIPLLFVFAFPFIFLEAGLGQFCSHGPGGCWEFAKLFQGVGYVTIILIMCHINFAIDLNQLYFLVQYFLLYGYPWDPINQGMYEMINLWHSLNLEIFFIKENFTRNLNVTISSTQTKNFQENISTENSTYQNNLADNHIYWTFFVCYCINWVIIGMLLLPRIRTRGKIVSIVFLFVALSLCLICARSLALPGAMRGIEFCFSGSGGTTLMNWEVLHVAISQCYFSLATQPGYHMTLASYNHFNNVISSDILLMVSLDLIFCGLGTLTMFSLLGHLSEKTSFKLESLKNLQLTEHKMAIVLLPRSMSHIEEGGFGWIYFFFTIYNILLHLNTTTKFEAVIRGVLDVFQINKTKRKYVVLIMCIIMSIASLWLVTDYRNKVIAGIVLYIDVYLPVLGFLLVTALLYSLGSDRFISMLECSVGWYSTPIMSNRWWKRWWKLCWKYIVPVILLALSLESLLHDHYHIHQEVQDQVDTLLKIIGWLLLAFLGLVIIGYMAYMIKSTKGHGGFIARIRFLTKPSQSWGPLLPQHQYIMEVGEEDRLRELQLRKRKKSSLAKDYKELKY